MEISVVCTAQKLIGSKNSIRGLHPIPLFPYLVLGMWQVLQAREKRTNTLFIKEKVKPMFSLTLILFPRDNWEGNDLEF